MPIYEYQCQSCGKPHEALQKISDAPLQDCPACGKPELKKKISAAGFRLKGGGWYETDFKTGSKKNLAGGGDSGASSGTDKAGGDKKSSGESKSSAPA
ncbi:FmdB family zinc ribbon protein [Parahaliea aestuarii]|uniref:Zinc ribbon domain-containing protein n=1 Tax=Parahaliea aestuarii TaxID=1852021 RepID=A0A5C9A657_9GAMM|nr:zinc ribbon domain-containing protein [Parahaliea aestuarii]TXS94651.1 zinc ribbon domain-containing protein [Parahaliea aestuarii]